MDIGELGLSVRAETCLRRAGIQTVGELRQLTDDMLLEIRNFGMKSLAEVHDALERERRQRVDQAESAALKRLNQPEVQMSWRELEVLVRFAAMFQDARDAVPTMQPRLMDGVVHMIDHHSGELFDFDRMAYLSD